MSAGEGEGGRQLLVDLAQLVPPRHQVIGLQLLVDLAELVPLRHLDHGHRRPISGGVHGELARHV